MKLVADIGGTKTLLAVADGGVLSHQARYENVEFDSADTLLARYLETLPAATRGGLRRASLAVAGPVQTDSARVTNRPHWHLQKAALATLLGVSEVVLRNDFVATALGLAGLAPAELVTLQAGQTESSSPQLCLGPGTGLGVAAVANGQVIASEGGHIAFAPTDSEQVELWRFLGGEHRRLIAERACSGPGLLACYRFCLIRAGHALPPDLDPAEVVRRADSTYDPDARHALALFARLFGAFAGDLALTFLARGGVYLTGGVAPKILNHLQTGTFVEAFNSKAEHSDLVRRIPVHVVLAEDLALRGAAVDVRSA